MAVRGLGAVPELPEKSELPRKKKNRIFLLINKLQT